MKTKPFSSLRLALAGALALITPTAFAQTWQTVDDFQYLGPTSARAISIDPSGNVFVAGGGGPSPGHAFIEKSSDGGLTWSTVDAFASGNQTYYYSAITTDTAGNLYAVGRYSTSIDHWVVRRSLDAGLTWSTVVDSTTFTPAIPFVGIATDAAGNVYLVGSDASSGWLVLKGTQAGTVWSTVDAFSSNGGRADVHAAFCHPTLGIFTVGTAPVTTGTGKKASTQSHWTVRRSLDGGASWATVDSAVINSSGGAATGIGADRVGNIYVVGGPNWTVRKSSNGGAAWTTVDTVLNAPFAPAGFAADSNGNLFVVGTSKSLTNSRNQWVVRENPGGTGAWQTVDVFQYVQDEAQAMAVAADNSGHVYVAGEGVGPIAGVGFYNQHWIVRKH